MSTTPRTVTEIETEGRERALAFRREHDLGTDPIKDVADLAEKAYRADITLLKMPDFLDGVTVLDPESKTVLIAIKTLNNPERQRFSIAHELGHLVFNELSERLHSASAERSDTERRADTFARHLLLPNAGLELFLGELGYEPMQPDERALSDVVSTFGVSVPVACIQMRETAWISRNTSDAWRQGLEASYLARRYGWAAERGARIIESQTERPAKRMLGNATGAYVDHLLSLETLAHLNGREKLDELRSSLESDGITPREAKPAPVDLDSLLGLL